MNTEAFVDLLWRLEEKLVLVDHLNNQIENCPENCGGQDAVNDEGLCPACCDNFAMLLAEEERLQEDKGYNSLLRLVRSACDQDQSGMYERILKQSREARIMH